MGLQQLGYIEQKTVIRAPLYSAAAAAAAARIITCHLTAEISDGKESVRASFAVTR